MSERPHGLVAPTRLKTVLGPYPFTRVLRSGQFFDGRAVLDFVPVEPVPKAFAPMVRRGEYDLCEMAVVTALQAFAYGKPMILLPAVVASRFQRGCLVGYRPNGIPKPSDLVGRRVGVRAYTQTTGMWVRQALWEDHATPAEAIIWRTVEGAHVEEYRDPPFVEHDAGDRSLADQLRAGDVAAAIFGADKPDDPDFAPILVNHAAADEAWYDRHGFMPINHMVAVTAEIAETAPEAVRAGYGLIQRAANYHSRSQPAPARTLFSADRLLEPLTLIIEAAVRQQLLPRLISAEDVLEQGRRLVE